MGRREAGHVLPQSTSTLAPQLRGSTRAPTSRLHSPTSGAPCGGRATQAALAHLPRRLRAQSAPGWRRRQLRRGARRGRTLARDLGGGGATVPALADSQTGALGRLPGRSCHSCGAEEVAGLVRAEPTPPPPTAGARVPTRRVAPGINCRAPGCRPPGALSGSDSAPGRRAGTTHLSARARAGPLQLPGSPRSAGVPAAARRLQGAALLGEPERAS